MAAVLAGLALVPSSAPASVRAGRISDLTETTAVHWGDARQAELTAAQEGVGDLFGNSVALSAAGRTALIGSPFYTRLTGTAYVFTDA